MKIDLTPQETILLYGFLGTVHTKVDMIYNQLDNPELTKSLLESVMTKIATELETLSNNN